jgi:hypothetical protein
VIFCITLLWSPAGLKELGRLAPPELVDGVDHHSVLAFLRREIEGLRVERKATEILTKRGRPPSVETRTALTA